MICGGRMKFYGAGALLGVKFGDVSEFCDAEFKVANKISSAISAQSKI